VFPAVNPSSAAARPVPYSTAPCNRTSERLTGVAGAGTLDASRPDRRLAKKAGFRSSSRKLYAILLSGGRGGTRTPSPKQKSWAPSTPLSKRCGMSFRLFLGFSLVLVAIPAWAQESLLDTVLKRDKLIVATYSTSPPLAYVDDSGKLVGFEIDMAREI